MIAKLAKVAVEECANVFTLTEVAAEQKILRLPQQAEPRRLSLTSGQPPF